MDRCPYSRSFTPAFADDPDCPAYQAATFTALDTAHRPLRSGLTCRHLTVGNDARREARFYPRCGLGDAGQRLRWVTSVTPARLAVMRSLEEEFNRATLAERHSLIESKAKLLEGDADPAAVEALEVDLSAFLDRVDTFLEERSARLGDVGLRPSQLQALLADWSMAWLRGTGVYAPPIEFIDRVQIPPHTAAFLGAAINTDTTTIAAERDVVAQAGSLVIERRLDDPTVLLVRGEIDAANSDTLATAVLRALEAVGDVTVDFHEVLFCDLGGLRALVRASATVSGDQRLRVAGLPGHLHRVLRLVGWTDLPGLVIEAYSGA